MKPSPPKQIDPSRPPGYGIEYDVAEFLDAELNPTDYENECDYWSRHQLANITEDLLKMMRANGYLREGL